MSIKQKEYFSLKTINPVIRFLTISDLMIVGSFGLIGPIFAVFIIDNIEHGSLEVAGLASAVFLLTKSIGQIPLAYLVDKTKGEKDDFWALIIGSVIFSIVPFLYLIIETPIELYMVQFLYGLGGALAVPTWRAIFTRHIDRDKEGIEWGVYSSVIDLSYAGAAALGGLIAGTYGFEMILKTVGIMSIIGSAFIIFIYKFMKPGNVLKKPYDR